VEPQVEQVEKDADQFLDFTVDDNTEADNSELKRKRDNHDNNSEDSDVNNSFELIYKTPMAKIGYSGNEFFLNLTLILLFLKHKWKIKNLKKILMKRFQ
jgi:hypothetical protein